MAQDSTVADVRRPPIKVGVVGLGRAALFGHLPALLAMPEQFKVVAICDLQKERRDIVEKDIPDVRTYRQIDDMFDDPDIELMDICLPSLNHAKIAMESLSRDKWTVVETPMALNHDDATMLRAAALKTHGKLFVHMPELLSPEFRLANAAREDPRLGDVYEVRIRHLDYLRRDDWQSIKRCGGGVAWHMGSEAAVQAIMLLRQPPAQLWSEMKRVVALGDTEDFVRIILKTRGLCTADVEINGGTLPPHAPPFTLLGTRGSFSVQKGATAGTFHVIDPNCKLPRKRASVKTPDLADMHEDLPVVDQEFSLPNGDVPAETAFWEAVCATIRTAAPFPVQMDDVVEAMRYLQLAKQASPFSV